MSLSRLAFLAVLSLALGASAEVCWTHENGVLTEIGSATSGSMLWKFNLNAGAVCDKMKLPDIPIRDKNRDVDIPIRDGCHCS